MSVPHDSLTPKAELMLSHVTGHILVPFSPHFYQAPLFCTLRRFNASKFSEASPLAYSELNSRLHSVKHTSRYCFHKRLKRSRSLARILQGSLRTNSPCNYHSKTKYLILCLYTSLISHWRSVIVDLNIFDAKLLTCRITSPMPWELFFRLQHRPNDKRVPFSENKYV
jgi:hypothetical protein